MIKKMNLETVPQALKLWNNAAKNEIPHKPFASEEDFIKFFIQNTESVSKTCIAFFEADKLLGFASGCNVDGKDVAYITFVLVEKDCRNKGIGNALLKELERLLFEEKSIIKKYDIVFFNPMQLEWFIPHSQKHDHPCAPGVDMSSPAFIFLKNAGYRDFAYQNSYYQPLHDYKFPSDIEKKIKSLEENNIVVTYYDKEKHTGLNELFDNLQNEGWRSAILANEALGDKALPLLVAVSEGKTVCGYTGPLSVQESGRGCFHGIGVHSEYRKHGAGKVLFSYLCMSLKEQGATFMSLYTGENNPARNIYEAAGFKIVRCWADMRKEIK